MQRLRHAAAAPPYHPGAILRRCARGHSRRAIDRRLKEVSADSELTADIADDLVQMNALKNSAFYAWQALTCLDGIDAAWACAEEARSGALYQDI